MPPSLQESDLIPGQDNTKRTAPTALLFTAAQWQQVLDHLRAALPAEGCGLLACAGDDDGDLTISRTFPGTNTLASATRYRMEPSEVIDAFRAMREEGLRLAAIFHSHPTTPPTLSEIDLREANYPDAALVIVSFAGGSPEAAAWALERQGEQWAAAKIPIRVSPA
jgi:proteasome lid subunit RPN8/RPN11